MADTNTRRYISNAFDRIHDQLRSIKKHVEHGCDEKAMKLYVRLEAGTLEPLKRLRLHLNIPYDWHDDERCTEDRKLKTG
jgi:hypothetical protein